MFVFYKWVNVLCFVGHLQKCDLAKQGKSPNPKLNSHKIFMMASQSIYGCRKKLESLWLVHVCVQ